MSGTSVTDRPQAESQPARWTISRWWAPLGGLVAVALAFASTELLAALGIWTRILSAASSPVQSLANTFITLTPEWLKHWAITQFGTNDKLALGAGMFATIAVAALILGLIARRHRGIAVGLMVVLAVVAAIAILTRTNSGVLDLLPLVIGTAVGVTAIRYLYAPNVATGPAVLPAPDSLTITDDTDGADGAELIKTAPGTGPDTGADDIPDGEPVSGRTAVGRRSFFRRVGLAGAAAVVAGAAARFIPTGASARASRAAVVLPTPDKRYVLPAGADAAIPGQTPLVTANQGFYRIDTSFNPPEVTAEEWSLEITGMVSRPMSVNFQQLLARPQIERPITLTCVSNEVGGGLAGNAIWLGTRIDTLLAEAGPTAGADCVLCTDVNGFTLSAPLEALTDGRDAILAVGMNGEALPIEHGFPVRMVVPGLYGFVSATKWIVSMELTKFSDVVAYWTARGWADHGPIKTASRIDTPGAFAQLKTGQNMVGGMAWAQHRGIAKVEVQVDSGPWEPAELSTPLSTDSWVQWKYQWNATDPGLRTLRVRATDSTGQVQTEERAQPIPNGSSGWHSRQVTVG